MTIDEEIEKQKRIAHIYSVGDDFEEYIEEHNQIAEWLEELKTLRYCKDKWNENQYEQGRQDAIDKIKKYVYLNIHFYDSIEQKGFYEFLEQLKEAEQ